MEQGSPLWYAVYAGSLQGNPGLLPPCEHTCCAGTLADRSEEAVYQSAGVISRSEAEIHDGEAVCFKMDKALLGLSEICDYKLMF